MNDFGLSFAPTTPAPQTGPTAGGGAPGRVNPVQDAIRVLSLRIPKTVGASAPAPQPLLTSPGMGGIRNTPGLPPNLQSMLSSFFQPPTSGPGPVESSPFNPGESPVSRPGPVEMRSGPDASPDFGGMTWQEILRRLFGGLPELPGSPGAGGDGGGGGGGTSAPPPNFTFSPPTTAPGPSSSAPPPPVLPPPDIPEASDPGAWRD